MGEKALRHTVLVCALSLMLVSTARGTEWTVPVDPECPTIQACIDQAADGDTIRIQPGTYTENIDFLGKAITVESLEGTELAVLDGRAFEQAVRFVSGEGRDAVLRRVTVNGGILCEGSSPSITENLISGHGCVCPFGILLILRGAPLVHANYFLDLADSCSLSILSAQLASPTITSNTFFGVESAGPGDFAAIRLYGVPDGASVIVSDNSMESVAAWEGSAFGIVLEGGGDRSASGRRSTYACVAGNTVRSLIGLAFTGSTHAVGIAVSGFDEVLVSANLLDTIQAGAYGIATAAGIDVRAFGTARIQNNLVTGVYAAGTTGGGSSGTPTAAGINVQAGIEASVLHNTVSRNFAETVDPLAYSAGIELGFITGEARIENNIVSSNVSQSWPGPQEAVGLRVGFSPLATGDGNDLWANGADYQGI